MLDILQSIADIFTAILEFFQGIVETISTFIESIKEWWETVLAIISMMPDPIIAICVAAFALLLVFIVIEILRDFL